MDSWISRPNSPRWPDGDGLQPTFCYFRPTAPSTRLGRNKNKENQLGRRGEYALNGQAGRRIGDTRSGVKGFGRRVMAGLWVASLLAILGFLVIYPVLTLLLGALTDTNPVVDGLSLKALWVVNFLTVLTNPNGGEALLNTLMICAGGTMIAVAIGLLFSWVVVRTNTPFRGLIAAASILPLFAPPLVAGVAWSILGARKSGLINTVFKRVGL